jgi:uncharacterized membrane protein YhaH (DUF805 family)
MNRNFSENALSWRGRFSRLSLLAWMGLSFIVFALVVVANIMYLISKPQPQANMDLVLAISLFWPSIFAVILLSYFSFVFTIRRLHDLNLSGWLSVLVYVPIVGFVFWLYLTFVRGSEGRNLFGHPRSTRLWEGLFGILIGLLLFVPMIIVPIYTFLNPSSQNMQVLSNMFKSLLGI